MDFKKPIFGMRGQFQGIKSNTETTKERNDTVGNIKIIFLYSRN